MRKFTVGLLAMLVAGIFATSPVSASVKKITMAVPAKKTDLKKTVSKDSKPAKTVAKNADKGKAATKQAAKTTKAVAPAREKAGKTSVSRGRGD